MITIPLQQDKKFSQTNTGDFSGNVNRTKNISFDDEGRIRLEKRTRNLFDSETYTDLTNSSAENIQSITELNTPLRKLWIAGTKSMYYLDSSFNLQKDTTASTPDLSSVSGQASTCQFRATAAEVLIVAYGNASVKYYNASALTWGTVATDVTNPYVVANFVNLKCVAVGGDNLVQLIDASLTKSTLLTLPIEFTVTSMDWNNNRMYIGTSHNLSGEALIFEWDGANTSANYGHPTKANQVLSVKRYDETSVVAVTSAGQLLKVAGSISVLANLPIYYSNKLWANNSNYSSYSRVVLDNGVVVDKEKIYIAVSSDYASPFRDDTDDTFKNDFPSGVWCYDPEVGLHLKYTIDGSLRNVTGAITTANVDTSTDIITIPTSTVPDTGTPVFYDDGSDGVGTLITPLVFNTRYFVIKMNPNTLKLATTYANAIAGTAIDLTTTGNNAQTLVFCPNDGFGGIRQYPRALFLLKQINNNGGFLPETSEATKLLIGSYITKTTSGTYNTGLHSVEHKQENRGYETTPILTSTAIKDSWQKVYLKFNPLVTEQDKIIVKYRTTFPSLTTRKVGALTAAGTWFDNTHFTTTDITDLAIGYEIEIVNGAGSGYLAHITNISDALAGVYTITIDETVQNIVMGQTFYFVADNWTKLSTFDYQSINNADGYGICSVGQSSKNIQFRMELRGEDVSIEEKMIVSSAHTQSQ